MLCFITQYYWRWNFQICINFYMVQWRLWETGNTTQQLGAKATYSREATVEEKLLKVSPLTLQHIFRRNKFMPSYFMLISNFKYNQLYEHFIFYILYLQILINTYMVKTNQLRKYTHTLSLYCQVINLLHRDKHLLMICEYLCLTVGLLLQYDTSYTWDNTLMKLITNDHPVYQ